MEFIHLSPANADEVSDIDLSLFDNGFGPSQIRAELSNGTGVGIRYRGELVAYAMARADGGMVDITRVGVVGSHQNRGLGHAVLRLLLQEVPSERYILCVRKTNLHALKLYFNEGFKIVGMLERSWVMLRG